MWYIVSNHQTHHLLAMRLIRIQHVSATIMPNLIYSACAEQRCDSFLDVGIDLQRRCLSLLHDIIQRLADVFVGHRFASSGPVDALENLIWIMMLIQCQLITNHWYFNPKLSIKKLLYHHYHLSLSSIFHNLSNKPMTNLLTSLFIFIDSNSYWSCSQTLTTAVSTNLAFLLTLLNRWKLQNNRRWNFCQCHHDAHMSSNQFLGF